MHASETYFFFFFVCFLRAQGTLQKKERTKNLFSSTGWELAARQGSSSESPPPFIPAAAYGERNRAAKHSKGRGRAMKMR